MNPVYILRVDLIDSTPPIWRRVQVPASITLTELHDVLQTVMGWENYHLHQFEIDGRRYILSGDDALEGDVEERHKRLDKLVTAAGQSFRYEYDFGDGWEHLITVEAIQPAEPPALAHPMCLDGERACPPEDCGGIGMYNELQGAYVDPEREEHAFLVEWLGYLFDPNGFDRNMVNRVLLRRLDPG